MNDVTMEQKLQLIRQVRSRYHENQYDLSDREQLLYGRPSYKDYDGYKDDSEGSAPPGPVSSFRLRFLAALLLLVLFILMDRNDRDVAGITTEKIYEMISADYEDEITEWMETMSR